MGYAHARPTPPTRTRDPHLIHQRDQFAGVGVLAWGEPGRQVAAAAVADRVDLGGQPAP
jgi:hypothetical protein